MKFIERIKDKWHRNGAFYINAFKKGEIVGYDYTLLLWLNHTKFLLRLSCSEDHQKELTRMAAFWESFVDVIAQYKDMPIYPTVVDSGCDAPIWIYWNDLSAMPLLVENCINRIRKYSNGHPVIIVSEKTVSEYLQLDDVVHKKYKEGKISRTHYCDIVRVALLAKYGGVWMDCTLLLTQPLPPIVTQSDFYTNHLNTFDYHNISGGRWSTFFLACHKDNLMMRAALDVFVEFWHRYDYLPDYVWMDYIFNLLYIHIPSIRQMIDSVPENNPDIWILQNQIGKQFSKEAFDALLEDKSRFLYKFSYKESIGVPYKDKEGKHTLLGRLCEII